MSLQTRLAFLPLFASAALFAQQYTVEGKADKPEAIYAKGEKITFSIQILADKKPAPGTKFKYTLRGDGNISKSGTMVSTDTPQIIETKLDYPGWVYVNVTPVGPDGKALPMPVNTFNGIGALVAPDEMKYAGKEPADFDAFWKAQRETLDKVPVKAALTKVDPPERAKKDFVMYDVKVDCAGAMPVSGYLSIPVNAAPKSCPAVVSYHGAGVRSSYKPVRTGAISFDVNAHGILNGQPAEFYSNLSSGELADYRRRNSNDKDKIYFKDMYLRVMRALDYVKTLPEWNGKDLIVVGGSQGGAQSIVAAALDPQVTLCLAGVPALSDHAGSLATPKRQAGWPRFYTASDGKLTPASQQIANTAEYFDNVNFAKRIKCETYISTGFIDTTCSPTSVYIVFKNIPDSTRKFITMTPNANHSAPNTKGNARLREILAK